jgi:hypothetical protein
MSSTSSGVSALGRAATGRRRSPWHGFAGTFLALLAADSAVVRMPRAALAWPASSQQRRSPRASRRARALGDRDGGHELPIYVGPVVLRAYPQVLSGVLTVRVVAFQYISTLFGRMPLAINKVSGTGFAGVTFA